MKFKKIKIIAEIGVNHNGNLNTAKKLIKVAKKSGADYAKFQMYEPDEMVTDYANKANYQNLSVGKKITQKKMLKKYYLSEKKIHIIKNYCKKVGINFLASVFDEKSLNKYIKLNPDFIKLPSPEINNYFLINKIKEYKKKIPVIFSTGMSTNKEISNISKILGKGNIIPMYCVSSYPTKIKEINLKKFFNLRKKYDVVGLSDHTTSLELSIICALNKVNIIERHLTLSKKQKGPDHISSLDPKEFKEFITSVRNIEFLISNKKSTNLELKNRNFVRKFLVAKTNISKGDKFTINNVTCKRTGMKGLDPMLFYKIKNKKSKKHHAKDELIKN
jgi:N,N'-diacetyllegionaminate synthase